MNVHVAGETPAAQPYADIEALPFSRLRLLGGFELVVRGVDRTGAFPYEKAKLLLAVLALAPGERVSRRELAAWLWPELPDNDARARLRHALHALRKVFAQAPEMLRIEKDSLSLDAALLDIDALAVLGLHPRLEYGAADKLSAYQGALLAGIDLPDGESMRGWRDDCQARIDIELALARSQLTDFYIGQGREQEALVHAKRWVSRWPEDEACHRHLIRLLVALDDREAAMRAFDHCTQVLADRLGAAPSNETWALLEPGQHAMPAIAAKPARIRPGLYRPLAVLAINVDIDAATCHDDAERAIDIQQRAILHIERHALALGGWLAPRATSTVLAYFGYPALSERPAHPAARLADRLASADLPDGVTLGMGLHADVALTEPDGQPDAGSLAARQAVRLAWQARDRETLVTQACAVRLSEWQLVQTGRRSDDYQALGAPAAHAPARRMFGRNHEFERLTALWNQLKGRERPQAVLLRGVAGIGKTALAQALIEYARQSGGETVLLAGQEHMAATPWHPVKAWLRAHSGIGEIEPGAGRAAHAHLVERLRAHTGLRAAAAERLWQWLHGADDGARGEAQQDIDLIEILTSILMQRTPAGRPQLIVWENLHWMDPASLGLIAHLAGRVVSGPTLLLATARDVYTPAWDHQAITVPPLDREATAQLAASLARTHRLSQGQRAQIQQESMGNPLYAGELAKCAAQLAMPQGVPSLADRVALQLNLLIEPERHTLQMLCLLCDDGPADAARLAEVLQTTAAALATRLETLGRHGLLHLDAQQRWRCPPPIAQAVRRYMLREQRGALHQRIAQHLQQGAGAPHEIARHLQQAGDPQAAQWWRTAVWEVVRRGDYAQAHRYLDNALALRHQIESDAERDEFEFACHMVRGELAGNLDGPGSMAAAQAYTLAERVSPGDPQSRFTALWALWNACQHSGDYDEAVSLAHQLLNMAHEHGKSGWRTWALYAMAICELWKGDVIESERLLRQALQGLVFPHTDIGPAPILGENAGALIHAMLALTVATQGRGDEAMQSVQTAMAYARQDNNPLMLAASSMMLVKFSYLYEDWAQMGMVAGALRQSMDAHPLRPQFLYALTSCYVDLAAALRGDASVIDNFEPALETIRRAMPTAEVSGQCLLACALNALGRPDRALVALDRADLLCARFRIAGMMPETLCLRGDALLLLGDLEQACAAWRQAIGHANRLAALQYARWAQRRLDANQLVATGP